MFIFDALRVVTVYHPDVMYKVVVHDCCPEPWDGPIEVTLYHPKLRGTKELQAASEKFTRHVENLVDC